MISKAVHSSSSFPVRTIIQIKTEPVRRLPTTPQPRLLIIDADGLYLQFLLYALSGRCQVLTARDVAEASRVMRHNQVDLLLVDLGSPACDSIILLQQVRTHARLRQIPLLVLATSAELRKRIAGLDVVAVMPKPRWIENLLDLVEQSLSRLSVEGTPPRTRPVEIEKEAPPPRRYRHRAVVTP